MWPQGGEGHLMLYIQTVAMESVFLWQGTHLSFLKNFHGSLIWPASGDSELLNSEVEMQRVFRVPLGTYSAWDVWVSRHHFLLGGCNCVWAHFSRGLFPGSNLWWGTKESSLILSWMLMSHWRGGVTFPGPGLEGSRVWHFGAVGREPVSARHIRR